MLRVRRFADLEACRGELDQLAPRARTPFVAPPWLRVCAAVEGGEPAVFVVYEGDRPIGYAAVRESGERIGGLRRMRFIGHRVSNYLEPVSEPGREADVWSALLAAWAGGRVPMLLDFMDLNDRSPARPALEREISGPHDSVPLYPCPEAHLSGDWEETFRSLVPAKKKRTEIRKFAARMESLGEVEFRVIRSGEEWNAHPGLMEEIAELHGLRFAGTLNRVLEGDSFSLLRAGLGSIMGRGGNVSLLRVDGALVSFVVALEAGETLIDYIPAFHPALSRFSAGHVHLLHLLRWACENGFRTFDFSKGDAVYKRRWATHESWNHHHLALLNPTPLARAELLRRRATVRLVAWGRERGLNARVKRFLGRLRSPRRNGAPEVRSREAQTAPSDLARFEAFRFGRLGGVPMPVVTALCDFRYAHPEPEAVLHLEPGRARVFSPDAGKLLALEYA